MAFPRSSSLLCAGWLVLVLAGCSSTSSDVDDSGSGADAGVTTTVAATTTTVGPSPPMIRMANEARVEVGQVLSDAIVVTDPNGDDVNVEVTGRTPDGFSVLSSPRGLVTGFHWRPTTAGQWDVDVTATDSGGLSTVATLTLVSRHPRNGDLVAAMGDSIAAGFGRDRSDFAGSDECFRSENDAYGVLVTAALVEAGTLAADAETMVVACAGATARALLGAQVEPTNASGDAFGAAGSQLDLVVAANPTIVTLTVGATDVSLFDAEALTKPGANGDPTSARDALVIERWIESYDRFLRRALDTLVLSTDAQIVVTTVYDPTAVNPIGVDGCNGQCFVDVMDGIVADLNSVIIDAVADQPADRVRVARLDGDADQWEASNGFGPDALRDLGPLQGLVDTFTGGSSATCSAADSPDIELISTLDCAHPNQAGHQEIARIVASTLLEQ